MIILWKKANIEENEAKRHSSTQNKQENDLLSSGAKFWLKRRGPPTQKVNFFTQVMGPETTFPYRKKIFENFRN